MTIELPPLYGTPEAARAWAAYDAIAESRVLWVQDTYRSFVRADDVAHLAGPTHIDDAEVDIFPSNASDTYVLAPEERARCRTSLCLAGTVCDLNGGRWLFTIDPLGHPLIAGAPASYFDLDHEAESYLLAEPDDNPLAIRDRSGHRVITAHNRASRLLGLDDDGDAHDLFSGSNRLDDLLQKVERTYGPRPASTKPSTTGSTTGTTESPVA
ncbi:hypothetical protein ACIBH1_45640 [Nonomuraea sp. NPDC050663]|uniref:hypothetical protein n=1 Tax=Nonomuraea sp. NPDC050663 TaxID=3364370 RepID=UPI0037B7E672